MSGNIPVTFWDNLKAYMKLKNELWRYGHLNSVNLTNMEQRYRDIEGKTRFSSEVFNAIQSDRDSIISIINNTTGLAAFWKELQEHIGSPHNPGLSNAVDSDFYQDVIDDMKTATAVTIRSRDFTRAAHAYAGTGNGGIITRTTDKNALAIEEGIATTVVIECTGDVSTGVKEGDEEFQIKTTGEIKDGIGKPTAYSYQNQTIKAMHARSEGNLLQNSDFSQYDSAASARFSGWSSLDYTMVEQDTTTYYRISQGTRSRGSNTDEAGVGYSAKLLPFAGGNRAQIYQRFTEQAGFDKNTPYTVIVFHYGGAGADGNVKVSLGSKNSTVAVAVGAWTVQALSYFPSEFDSSPLDVKIERLADSAGNVFVSNVMLVPMTKFNGQWRTIYAGATNFILGDGWTQSVTLPSKDVTTPFAVEGKLQREIVKRTGSSIEAMDGIYLNHSTSPTIDDWTQITGTATFVAGPAVTITGANTKYLDELHEDYYVYNATDDLPDDAVACDEPTTNTACDLKTPYLGTAGAGKKIGVIIPWECFC